MTSSTMGDSSDRKIINRSMSRLTWANANRAASLVDSGNGWAVVRVNSGGCCENSNDEGGLHDGGEVLYILLRRRVRWEGR